MKPEPRHFDPGYAWVLGILGLLWLSIAGCEDHEARSLDLSLVCVNDRAITVGEFNRRFDAVSAEFPEPEKADPAVERDMKLQLLHQLTEELILLERADELNLVVSDLELAAAIKKIRADYPEGEFENMLVEQAIVYGEWKDKLRTRLLKEKVVREDLETSIVLNPEEVSVAYEANYPANNMDADRNINDPAVDEKVVKLVRRQKAQAVYQEWLLDLKTRYAVIINAAAWEELIGS
jgi:hypothetical protein